jgi:hypothetical protein
MRFERDRDRLPNTPPVSYDLPGCACCTHITDAEAAVMMIYCCTTRYVTVHVNGQTSKKGNTLRRGSANETRRLGRNPRFLAHLKTNRHSLGTGQAHAADRQEAQPSETSIPASPQHRLHEFDQSRATIRFEALGRRNTGWQLPVPVWTPRGSRPICS